MAKKSNLLAQMVNSSITIAVDETEGNQNDATGSASNDFTFGSGSTGILPPLFDAALAVVAAGQGDPAVALSGYGTTATATTDPNGLPVITFDGTVNDVGFTNAAGQPLNGELALDQNGDALRTTEGTAIFLYTYAGDNNVLLGRLGNNNGTPDVVGDDTADPNGMVIFAAYLDTGVDTGSSDPGATAAKVWLVEYESIFHPDATNPNDVLFLGNPLNVSVNTVANFSLEGAPSGQNLFLMFGDGTPSPDDVTIVVTGKHPANQSTGASITTGDSVNTGQGGGMTTIGSNNQMIDPLEGMYFTFVTGANTNYTVPNLSQTEADIEANIDFQSFHGVLSASFGVVQLQPPKGATLMVSAFNNTDASEKGTQYIDGLGDGDDDPVNIDTITITRSVKVGNVLVPTDYEFSEGGVTSINGLSVDFSGDTAIITGIVTGDRVTYSTGTEHNRVLIDNVGNSDAKLNASFDIGAFRLESGSLETVPFQALAFVDDAPTASGEAVSDAVDEDGLPTGLADGPGDVVIGNADGDNNEATTSGSVVGIFAPGADEPASYSLSTETSGLPVLTSQGAAVSYAVVGNVLTATADGRGVFTFTLDSSTGAYSFTLQDQLDHPSLDGLVGDDEENNLALQLGSILQVTDKDGDTVTASAEKLVIDIDDDTPTPVDPAKITVNNVAAATAQALLGYIGTVGADEPGVVHFVGTDGMLLQGDILGNSILPPENLKLSGANIYLFGFGTSTLTATTSADNSVPADRVFEMTLNPDGSVAANDLSQITMFKTITNIEDIQFGDVVTTVKSGNPLTLIVNDIGGSYVDAFFSGFVDLGADVPHPGAMILGDSTQTTVNVSQAGVGVGTGQDFNFDANGSGTTDDLTDRIRIEFLDDADNDGLLDAGEAVMVNRFTFDMNQNNSPADDGDAVIRVYGESGTEIAIKQILVNGETLVLDGVMTAVASNDGGNVTADAQLADGGYVLHGLGGGNAGSHANDDTVTIVTETGYYRIDISGIGNDEQKDTFDILLNSVALPVVRDIEFTVQVAPTDYDGDTAAPSDLDVALVGVMPTP